MSILIKRMEFPKDCKHCPFMVSQEEDDICILQSKEANARFLKWEEIKSYCPLVEVPDNHGRLIDADALPWENQRIFLTDTDEWGLPCRDIDNAPTVIPSNNHGKWESYLYDEKYFFANYCSECKIYLPYGIDWKPNFCPNCGADMRQ